MELRSGGCYTLHWRHNERDGVSNHQPHHCLLSRLFRRIKKKQHQSSATLAFLRWIPPHTWPVTRKRCHLMTSSWSPQLWFVQVMAWCHQATCHYQNLCWTSNHDATWHHNELNPSRSLQEHADCFGGCTPYSGSTAEDLYRAYRELMDFLHGLGVCPHIDF